MELKEILVLARRWLWLLIAGTVLGLVGGFFVSKLQTPVYEVSAKVMVSRSRTQGATDVLSMSDQQLIYTYKQLLKTRPFLDEAGSRLGIKIESENVGIEILSNTQILQINVQDHNPEQAVAVANTLIEILIEQNETLQAGRYAVYEDGLNSQISQVQEQISKLQSQVTEMNRSNVEEQLELVGKQIADLQQQISSLEGEIAKIPSRPNAIQAANLENKQTQVRQLRELLYLYQQIQTNLTFTGEAVEGSNLQQDPQLANLQSTLSLYRQLYLNLLNNLESVKLARAQSTPTVTKIEEASIPNIPIRPIPLLYTAFGGVLGFGLAAGFVLLKNYLDDTLQSSQKIREMLGLPVLAEIAHADKSDQDAVASSDLKTTPFFNSFGILRINVSRLMAQNPQKSILVTSGSLGEGKTTVALNLATAFAKARRRVVLIDADFYKPVIHSRLKLDNQRGLTEILGNHTDWREVAKESDGVIVITSGKHPLASAVQLESNGMTHLLKSLQEEFDMIIIDAPPLFIVDTQVLCTQVGGILLVVRQANTTAAAVRTMLDQLKLLGVDVLGVVLNRVPRGGSYYYGGYYHNIHEENPEEAVDDIKTSES